MSPKSDGTWKPKGEKYDNPFKIPTDDDVSNGVTQKKNKGQLKEKGRRI